MRNIVFLLSSLFFIFSCDSSEEDLNIVKFAIPQVQDLSNIRNGINVQSAQNTNSDGKIYVAENFLFYIAKESGVHVFDNHNPANPQNVAFINIPGVHDIAIKGNYLFADNYIDLLVFDISNLSNIQLIRTVENVIDFYAEYPAEAEYYDNTVPINFQTQIITSYQIEERAKPADEMIYTFEDFAGFNGITVGVGGSYAKFQINNNALYTLNSYNLNIFDITTPNQTQFHSNLNINIWSAGVFETLFKQKNYLFIGSTQGMHIINIDNEFSPTYISSFSHATACDPVVVNDDTAYITVRGGNTCGAIDDQMNAIDISNINQPTLISTVLIEQPYGLGYHNNVLYVCTQNSLKIFDVSNPNTILLEQSMTSDAKDVIALDSHLITVGNQKLTQYQYGNNFTLVPISTLQF